MFFILRLWIVAWMCAPSHTKNLPLVMAATEPTAVMEGSEFDKAFAVVNAMFEQITRVPGHASGKEQLWKEGEPTDEVIDTNDHSKEASAPTEASKETFPPNTYYIKAKDSDFILIDPLDDNDRNAAALSKMVQGSYQSRRRESQEDLQVPEPTLLPSPESGVDHDVAATEDSKEQDEVPGYGREDDQADDDDQGDQGPGPEDDQGEEEENDEPPARHSRAEDRESREFDDDEDEDDGAPLEGAPVTEEDLDDFPPETFMQPTVLGVARHYQVGSSFSVFPVHIPNAPEHIELGSGVPTESEEEDAPPPTGDDDGEKEEGAGDDDDDVGDMEPHATTSSHYVVVEPAASENDGEEAPVSFTTGHRVSEHGEDESHWVRDGGEHEADEVEHDAHGDEGDGEENAEKRKEGAEKSKSYKGEGGAKKSDSLKEVYDAGKHHDDGAVEEEEGEEEQDGYGKKKMQQGFHDKYNYDKRTSRNRFYKNGREKGDWINSGEDERTFYRNTEGDEAGSFGKYNRGSDVSGSHGGKKSGSSIKKEGKWKKSKGKGTKEEETSAHKNGKSSKSGRGHYSWEQ